MGRGIISGLIWGMVLAVGVVGVVSLLSPLPQSPDVAATAPGSGTAAPVGGGGDDARPDGRDGDLVELAPTAPGGTAPGDLSALAPSDTRPAALPAVGGASDGLARPGTAGQAPEIAGDAEAPVAATPQAAAPAAPSGGATAPNGPQTRPAALPRVGAAIGGLDSPGATGGTPQVRANADARVGVVSGGIAPVSPTEESNLSISNDPAQPSAPVVGEAESGFGAPAPKAEPTPEVSDAQDTGPLVPVDVVEAARPATETGPKAASDPATPLLPVGEPGQPQATAPTGTEPPATAAEQPVQAPQVAATAPEQPGAAPAQPATPAPGSQSPPPRIAVLPQAGQGDAGEGPGIGTRVVPLTERNKVATLTLSGDAGAEEAAPQTPPLERYAADFDNPQDKPEMAIVLIDDKKSLGYEALAEFPYPLSFAIDPVDPKAAEKMARYRAAGFEVVLLADLPTAASARDAEVMLAAGFDRLPETVAILEGVGSGIQGNRELATQVSDIARATGRGLITQNNGLNTVEKLAARSGVPAAIVFRDFDGAGQTPTIMRRFLDQAAFRAGQEGAVIMLGRVRPNTISALLLWGLQDRASRVALVPVSAVLTRQRK